MVQREIVHGAVEPAAWLADLLKLRVKFHERFLNHVLSQTEFADQSLGITQQGRFQSRKKLLNRFPSGPRAP